jgi:hypothetical protein
LLHLVGDLFELYCDDARTYKPEQKIMILVQTKVAVKLDKQRFEAKSTYV